MGPDPPSLLVLASASASRKRVLGDAGICFECVGVGSALLAEARRRAVAEGRRMWLITGNDNPGALGFYQRRGMDLVALHCGFAETVRRAKPRVKSEVGGIAFRHAIELEYPAP